MSFRGWRGNSLLLPAATCSYLRELFFTFFSMPFLIVRIAPKVGPGPPKRHPKMSKNEDQNACLTKVWPTSLKTNKIFIFFYISLQSRCAFSTIKNDEKHNYPFAGFWRWRKIKTKKPLKKPSKMHPKSIKKPHQNRAAKKQQKIWLNNGPGTEKLWKMETQIEGTNVAFFDKNCQTHLSKTRTAPRREPYFLLFGIP